MRVLVAAMIAAAAGIALLALLDTPPKEEAPKESSAQRPKKPAAVPTPNPFLDGDAEAGHAKAATASGASSATAASDAALATYWAPSIENDTSRPYLHEFITRLDWDGDWDLTNNWENRTGAQPAAAYNWVVQTSTHAFLGYAFYRLANNDEPPDLNEMQGAIVVVRRAATVDGARNPDVGTFESVAIWSHGRYEVFTEQDGGSDLEELADLWAERLRPAGLPDKRVRKVAGDIDFIIDKHGAHPLLYSDEDHHRLSEGPGERPDGPGVFTTNIIDWRHKDYLTRKATAGDSWGQMRGIPQDGIMYVYSGFPRLPVIDKTGKGRGRFKHHWELVGYQLIGLEELWKRRDDPKVFIDGDMLVGDGRYRPLHLAPWAWVEDSPGLEGLDPVRSPGELYSALVQPPVPFDATPVSRSITLNP